MNGEHPNTQEAPTTEPQAELQSDSPDGQFAAVLQDAEKGEPINTQDLINALWWRLRNQRREIARVNEQNMRLREDIKELTCGDPRKVCPNCREDRA